MRISDWSSDVCSSDLLGAKPRCAGAGIALECGDRGVLVLDHAGDGAERTVGDMPRDGTPKLPRRDAPRLAIGSGWDDRPIGAAEDGVEMRSEEHTSELQSLMRISYAVFCLKKNKTTTRNTNNTHY